jgi:anti-sigma regulatory factor (Ser/Thr protein kinase)
LVDPALTEFRIRVLETFGATGSVRDELLAYNATPFTVDGALGVSLPLLDEPHIGPWEEYVKDAATEGVLPALRKRLLQLQFPIAPGMSQNPVYRAATRRGIPPPEGDPWLELLRPEGLILTLNPTAAGRVPILVVAEREDFVSLVQAMTGRNEPVRVPPSMGACIVTGYNNWDRVARYRKAWELTTDHVGDEDAWTREFQTLSMRKELYQDRFIILSSGPYSAVAAEEVSSPMDNWPAESVRIRREHECTHYFTYRIFGAMRNNLLDEVLADLVGLLHARGKYEVDLALRFFGLEDFPQYRQGGRLESYLGTPPLSEKATEVLRSLVYRTVHNLGDYLSAHPEARNGLPRARLVLALATLNLEELADEEMVSRVEWRFSQLPDVSRASLPLLRVKVDGTVEGLKAVLQGLNDLSSAHPNLRPAVAEFYVAIDELVANLVLHAPQGGKPYKVSVEISDRGDTIDAEVIDDGPHFNPLVVPEPATDTPLDDRPVGGLGIHIVRTLMDGVSYRRVGDSNRLLLRKTLAPPKD